MRRLSRETVRMRVAIMLTVLKPYQKRSVGLESSAAIDWLADQLVDRIMGKPESEAVLLVPDMAGPSHTPHHGKWGVDEPHPFPDMPFADH